MFIFSSSKSFIGIKTAGNISSKIYLQCFNNWKWFSVRICWPTDGTIYKQYQQSEQLSITLNHGTQNIPRVVDPLWTGKNVVGFKRIMGSQAPF